jgi:hypothetical protein
VVCLTEKELTELKIRITIQNTNNMNWVKWTSKSENVPFKSTAPGIGDGEEKVAAELDSKVLGQNSSYDMKVVLDGIAQNCDVKKLDHNTFNTGVEGCNALRPIKNNISDLLNRFRTIRTSSLLNTEECLLLESLQNINADEICVSNLRKINQLCRILYEKRRDMQLVLPIVATPFQRDLETIRLPLDKYCKICEIIEEPLPVEYEEYKEKLLFLEQSNHLYIKDPYLLIDSLNKLIYLFETIKLIFVDEMKGYYICSSLNSVRFERITRGHPRFRVFFSVL